MKSHARKLLPYFMICFVGLICVAFFVKFDHLFEPFLNIEFGIMGTLLEFIFDTVFYEKTSRTLFVSDGWLRLTIFCSSTIFVPICFSFYFIFPATSIKRDSINIVTVFLLMVLINYIRITLIISTGFISGQKAMMITHDILEFALIYLPFELFRHLQKYHLKKGFTLPKPTSSARRSLPFIIKER